jgi:uncharacterized membrane protein (DUF485 family)
MNLQLRRNCTRWGLKGAFKPIEMAAFLYSRQERFMAGFGHGEIQPKETEDPVIAARNARYGMVLFLVYLAIYTGFVGLNAFRPDLMELTRWGLNLAILYGSSLIIIAMVLALVYCWLCRARRVP